MRAATAVGQGVPAAAGDRPAVDREGGEEGDQERETEAGLERPCASAPRRRSRCFYSFGLSYEQFD
jgi:hypothetical protein